MTSSESQERKPAFDFLFLPFRACLTLRRARIITVEPAFFLFMWARHLYLPLYEQYYYVHYGTQILQNTSFPFPNGTFCLNSTDVDTYAGNGSFKFVETASNNLVVYGQIANRIPSIIASIIFGPLSDRFGRKLFLALIGTGTALQGSLALVTVYFQWSPYYFIIGHFISGAMGDFPGILTTGLSYIADISSKRWRGLRIGIIEAVSGIGAALGPILVGMWLQRNSCDFIPVLGFYTASSAAVALYCLFCIPESLTKSEREVITVNNPKGCKSLIRGIKIYFGFVPEYSAWRLWIAFFVNNLLILIGAGAIFLAVYFLKAPPFDLDAQAVGIYQSVQCLSRGMANVVLMGIFSAIQMPEAVIALIAMLFNSGCNLLTGLSRKVYQVYAGKALPTVQLRVTGVCKIMYLF